MPQRGDRRGGPTGTSWGRVFSGGGPEGRRVEKAAGHDRRGGRKPTRGCAVGCERTPGSGQNGGMLVSPPAGHKGPPCVCAVSAEDSPGAAGRKALSRQGREEEPRGVWPRSAKGGCCPQPQGGRVPKGEVVAPTRGVPRGNTPTAENPKGAWPLSCEPCLGPKGKAPGPRPCAQSQTPRWGKGVVPR